MNSIVEKLGVTSEFLAPLTAFFLMFARVTAMVVLVPFIGGRGIPSRIKVVTSVVLTGFVFMMIKDDAVNQIPESQLEIIVLFLKEIFFGLAIGITTIMCFYAIEAAGRIVDNQRGSANAQIFLPSLGQVSIFGLFEFWVGLSLFCYLDGHIMFLDGFYKSFSVMPVWTMPTIEPGITPVLSLFIRMSADVLVLGMQLAAPVLISIFLTDLVLGIANKMAPQIPVFEIGFMMKGYVGVGMVYVSIVVLAQQMEVFFATMHNNVTRVVLYFSS